MKFKNVALLAVGFMGMSVSGCGEAGSIFRHSEYESYAEFEAGLAETYSRKPSDYSVAYKLMKRGAANSWLATIHGYPDNGAVCEELIEPYNNDPSLSVMSGTYYCEAIG